jgi:hypothetical protein
MGKENKMDNLDKAIKMLSEKGLTISKDALLGGYGEFTLQRYDSEDCGIGEYSVSDGIVIRRKNGDIVFDGSYRINQKSVKI